MYRTSSVRNESAGFSVWRAVGEDRGLVPFRREGFMAPNSAVSKEGGQGKDGEPRESTVGRVLGNLRSWTSWTEGYGEGIENPSLIAQACSRLGLWEDAVEMHSGLAPGSMTAHLVDVVFEAHRAVGGSPEKLDALLDGLIALDVRDRDVRRRKSPFFIMAADEQSGSERL
jgi:hypothetical protein